MDKMHEIIEKHKQIADLREKKLLQVAEIAELARDVAIKSAQTSTILLHSMKMAMETTNTNNTANTTVNITNKAEPDFGVGN